MMPSVGTISPSLPIQSALVEEKKTRFPLIEAIVQIAVRILFISATLLMTAVLLPLRMHAVVLPLVGFSATLLSGFFYPKRAEGLLFGGVSPLIDSFETLVNGEIVPADRPRGFTRTGMNCSFNAVAHFLDADPQLSTWLRIPLDQTLGLEQFMNILSEYQPPQSLVTAFREYMKKPSGPLSSIPERFLQFLAQWQAPRKDEQAVATLGTIFRKLIPLKKAYARFYQQNDEAIKNKQAVSEGDSQTLREATHQVLNTVSGDPRDQCDAEEVMRPLLELLPPHRKAKVRIQQHLNVNAEQLVPPRELPQPQEQRLDYFPLPLDGAGANPSLPDLFARYQWGQPGDFATYPDKHGERKLYQLDRTSTELLEPPPALRFQLGRFRYEVSSHIKRGEAGHGVKLHTPVNVPEEMEIKVRGKVYRYRLASFIHHNGEYDGGHYTAGEIRGHHRYLMNDREVTLMGPQDSAVWQRALSQAYLLCYLPVN